MQSTTNLQTAAKNFAAGQYDQAETICLALVDKNIDTLEARHLLALVKRRQGKLSEAATLFLACIEMAPARADIHANYGNLLGARGDVAAAIDAYRHALEIDSEFHPAGIALARIFVAAGLYEKALAEAERLLERDPEDAQAWAVCANAQRGLENPNESEIAFRKAIGLNPAYGPAHHDFGALLAQQSRHEEALEELDLAVKNGVTGPEIVYNIASSLAGLSQFDASEALLTKATQALPQAIELHRLLARLKYMRGESDFDSSIRAAAASNPDSVPLRVAHAQLLRASGDLDAAWAVLDELDKTASSDMAVQHELASIHQESGRYSEALACAERLVENTSEFGVHTDLIIDALMSLGRADEAMLHINLAREQVPLNQWYIAMQATAARLLGDPQYELLYDYERFVRPFQLEAPPGWSSIEAFQRDLNAVLIDRHQFHAQPLDQSLRQGTQTPRSLLEDPHPVIVAFLQALEKPLAEYRQHIGHDPTHPLTARNHGKLKMTGCWSVRLRKNGYHVNHVHPEGWISSAYYAEVPAEVGDAESKSGWIQFGEPLFPVPGANAEKFIQPQAGSLVLFPSYMWHGTIPIKGDEPRMTVAFDAVSEN
jgi:uncharacterized protein (TIGR02466 family)